MNLRRALGAALRGDPDMIPKVSELLRDRLDEDNGRFATVLQAAEALEPIIAEAVNKRPSRLGRLGLSGAQLLASLTRDGDGSDSRLKEIARGTTVGIVFADVADFTNFTASHGDDEAVKLLNNLRERVDAIAAQYKGECVKSLGDGFLLAFPSASQSLGSATKLAAAGRTMAKQQPDFGLRIAVHAGEPSIEGDDMLGHDVNLTARLLDHCKPGGVVVSEAAKTLAERKLRKITFSKPKQVKVKGLAGKVTVHYVSLEATEA
jgi:class 3 adenylate cyclase